MSGCTRPESCGVVCGGEGRSVLVSIWVGELNPNPHTITRSPPQVYSPRSCSGKEGGLVVEVGGGSVVSKSKHVGVSTQHLCVCGWGGGRAGYVSEWVHTSHALPHAIPPSVHSEPLLTAVHMSAPHPLHTPLPPPHTVPPHTHPSPLTWSKSSGMDSFVTSVRIISGDPLRYSACTAPPAPAAAAAAAPSLPPPARGLPPEPVLARLLLLLLPPGAKLLLLLPGTFNTTRLRCRAEENSKRRTTSDRWSGRPGGWTQEWALTTAWVGGADRRMRGG
jgi:hypothetical protein